MIDFFGLKANAGVLDRKNYFRIIFSKTMVIPPSLVYFIALSIILKRAGLSFSRSAGINGQSSAPRNDFQKKLLFSSPKKVLR